MDIQPTTADFYLINQSVNSESALVLRSTLKPYGLSVGNDFIKFDGRPVVFENMFHEEDKKSGVVHQYMNAHEASRIPIFSRQVYKALRKFDYSGVQFIQAVIRGQDGKYVEKYHTVNTFDAVDILDLEKSEFDESIYDESGELIPDEIKYEIEKVVFSSEKMAALDKSQLRIFKVENFGRRVFVSKEIKQVIEQFPPLDIDFIRMDTWDQGSEM